MAGTEAQTNSKENGSYDHDAYVDCSGTKPVTSRERVLFTMSTIRTVCALLGAVAQAISLYMIYWLRYHHG